jgi:hypothetical protein
VSKIEQIAAAEYETLIARVRLSRKLPDKSMSWTKYPGRAKEFYTQNPIKALLWTAVINGCLKTLT